MYCTLYLDCTVSSLARPCVFWVVSYPDWVVFYPEWDRGKLVETPTVDMMDNKRTHD